MPDQRPGLGRVFQPSILDNDYLMSDVVPRQTSLTRMYWAGNWWGDQGQTPQCFPPETRILMADGSEKKIEEIRFGDRVQTHRGRSRIVTKVMERSFIGDLVGLQVRGLSTPLWSTSEHPYLTTTHKTVDRGRHTNSRSACVEPISSGWVKAEDSLGEYLHFPVTGANSSCLGIGDHIDLMDLIPELMVSADGTQVRLPKCQVAKSLPRWVELTPEFAWLVGLFVAEGSAAQGRNELKFSLAAKEEHTLAAFIAKAVKNSLGHDSYFAFDHSSNSMTVHIDSTTAATLMRVLGGAGISTHRLHPSIFSWSPDLLRELWRGWCDGDTEKRTLTIEAGVTTSPQLARDMWRLGLLAGQYPTMVESQWPTTRGKRAKYVVSSYHGSHTRRPRDDNYLYLKVKSIQRREYEGLVYNLEVEEDHSYVAEMAVVHNCTAYSWTGFIMDGIAERGMTAALIQPADLYAEEQQIDGLQHAPIPDNSDQSGGSTVRAGAKVLAQRGMLTSYHWASNASTVARAILTIGPVVVGTQWLSNMFEPAADGMVTVSGDVAGGHAYLLDGVNTTKKIFRIKNSWGRSWGIQGWGFIKMSDMDSLLKDQGEGCLPIESNIIAPRPFDPNAASMEPD